MFRRIAALPNVRAVVARPWFATRAYAGTQRLKALIVGVPTDQTVDRVDTTAGSLAGADTVLTDTQNARLGVWSGGHGRCTYAF